MNTTETELQSLRQELANLRNENIALYNELTKQNKTLCAEIISLREQIISIAKDLTEHHGKLYQSIAFYGSGNLHDDLKIHLTRSTAAQTAEFIISNMPMIKSFDDIGDYLKYVVAQVSNIGGLYLEFGVFQGNSINFISSTVPDKIIYGFDSFEGLPEDWRYDSLKGSFSANGNLPRVNKNVRLVKGWFNDTLPEFVRQYPQKCAFIHVDCDLYSSAKTIFDNLKNQIGSGTVIAFDEYFNYPGWQQGEYKAFMEFVAETGLNFEYIARTNFQQAAVIIK